MPASEDRACLNCGGPFTTSYGFRPGPPAKYCSAKCCNQFNLRKARERRRAEAASVAAALAPNPIPEAAAKPEPVEPVLTAAARGNLIRNQRHAEGARHGVDPTTCEREYSDEEREFLRAVDRYRRECKRPWPTATELLQIAVSLGYRKVAPAGPLPGAK